jgi:hypothetical protein
MTTGMTQNLGALLPAGGANADGRQSRAAYEIARGTTRCLRAHGFACVSELTLANGRRADLLAINASSRIWIVEVKSSLADFNSDAKWPEYRDFCDQLYFAVGRDFPIQVLPSDVGLIIADAYGGEIVRPCPECLLPGTRRKEVTLRFARTAAQRLHALADPEGTLEA